MTHAETGQNDPYDQKHETLYREFLFLNFNTLIGMISP